MKVLNYYDYRYLQSQQVAFGWVDTTPYIKSPMALGLSQNITEFWCYELTNYYIPFTMKNSIDDVLNWAADLDCRYVVVATLGNHLSDHTPFPQSLSEYISGIDYDDFTVAGHVLDKKDNFIELHHQMILVNVQWWKDAGRPEFGRESHQPITLPNINRSEENWHDDYTPHWVSLAEGEREYTGTRNGYNIVLAALQSNKKVYSFPKLIRLAKIYIYPEVNSNYHNKLDIVQQSLNTDCRHFVANTETAPYINYDKLPVNSFNGAVSTAGGLSPLLNAFAARLQPGDKLLVTDCSFLSLEIQRRQIQKHISLTNIKDEIHVILNELNSSGNIGDIRKQLFAYNNISRMQEVINSLIDDGLLDFYHNVFTKLNIEFRHTNYFIPERAADMIDHAFHGTDAVFINISNVYHYQHTAWLFSQAQRNDFEKQFVTTLAGYSDKYVIKNLRHHGHSWNCINAREVVANSEKLLSPPEYIKDLPWTRKH